MANVGTQVQIPKRKRERNIVDRKQGLGNGMSGWMSRLDNGPDQIKELTAVTTKQVV